MFHSRVDTSNLEHFQFVNAGCTLVTTMSRIKVVAVVWAFFTVSLVTSKKKLEHIKIWRFLLQVRNEGSVLKGVSESNFACFRKRVDWFTSRTSWRLSQKQQPDCLSWLNLSLLQRWNIPSLIENWKAVQQSLSDPGLNDCKRAVLFLRRNYFFVSLRLVLISV